jgi:hypothetical protein
VKNFDSRTYSINDFLEWRKNDQLELSPRFQRRSVWTDNARSYLMDTIVRGKPIPKVFIRQKLNPVTKQSSREVVDGQQRLRTILGFLDDGFQINPRHNPEAGGRFFSQLDESLQIAILNYEIAVDLLVNMPDPEVLDVFGRLNSYAVVLNEQERLNATHFGPFKLLADQLGHEYSGIWVKTGVLTDAQVVRMADVALAADLLIAMIEGIRSKKQIKNFYEQYEIAFENDVVELVSRFRTISADIEGLFEGQIASTPFRRIHIFYSLFTALYAVRFGLRGVEAMRTESISWSYPRLRQALAPVDELFGSEDKRSLSEEQQQFLEDSRRATTDAKVRLRRTHFIATLLLSVV